MDEIASIIGAIGSACLFTDAAVAVWFAARGVDAHAPEATDSFALRPLLLPRLLLLWALVVRSVMVPSKPSVNLLTPRRCAAACRPARRCRSGAEAR